MSNELEDFLARNMPGTPQEELETIMELMPLRHYKKGHVLLKAGQVAHESYMNLKGLVRSYYLIDGVEQTTAFYQEEEPIASLLSYNQKIPADHYFECMEDCALAVLTWDNEQEMYRRFPHLERGCRIAIEEGYGRHQQMLARYISSTPEQRYLHLLETSPQLLNRVPQYYLASYLGVKPESLSRIRKRLVQKS